METDFALDMFQMIDRIDGAGTSITSHRNTGLSLDKMKSLG